MLTVKLGIRHMAYRGVLAEKVGFEPTEAFTSAVFKTAAFNHSANPPYHVCSAAGALRGCPEREGKYTGDS